MEQTNIVVVYHPNCRASTDFIIAVSKVPGANIEYINIKEDKIESQITVDVVPMMILNNSPNLIFKGKEAFDKVESLILNTPVKTAKKETGGVKYNKKVAFVEQTDKKEKIDLSKK